MLAAQKIAKIATTNTFIIPVGFFSRLVKEKTPRSQPHFNTIEIRAIERMPWNQLVPFYLFISDEEKSAHAISV